MEDLDKLFRGAERLKPRAAMWKAIATRAELAKAPRGHEAPAPEPAYGLRLAASVAIALGALAALVMVGKGPMRSAGKAGGAEDFAGAIAVNAAAAPKEADLLDAELLDWHADLGEANEADWDGDGYLLTTYPAEGE